MRRRVLIARQDSVGDVLLMGPAVRAVAASGAAVTFLCGPRGRSAAELLPGVEEVLCWRADWIDPDPEPLDPAHVDALVASVGERRIEEAIILTSFHQSPLPLAMLLRLAGVRRIAAISDDYPGSLLDVRHRVADDAHESQRALSLVAAAGYPPALDDDGRLDIRRGGELPESVAAMRPYVVVHPGASVPARAWSPRRMRQLVVLLCGDGRNVVVTGSPDERELTREVCRGAIPDRVLDVGGETDLAGLAEVLAAAEAVVVGNTGPAHLAAAAGTPVVSIYAPTVPSARWHPWQVPFELLHAEVPCEGCRARECPVPGHPCVEEVAASDALDALERLLLLAAAQGPRAAARAPAMPAGAPGVAGAGAPAPLSTPETTAAAAA